MREPTIDRRGVFEQARAMLGYPVVPGYDLFSVRFERGRDFFFHRLRERNVPMTFGGCQRLITDPSGKPSNPLRVSAWLNELIALGAVEEIQKSDGQDEYAIVLSNILDAQP